MQILLNNFFKIRIKNITLPDRSRYWLIIFIMLAMITTKGELTPFSIIGNISIFIILVLLFYFLLEIFIFKKMDFFVRVSDTLFLKRFIYVFLLSSVIINYTYYGYQNHFIFSIILALLAFMPYRLLPYATVSAYFLMIYLYNNNDIDVYISNTAGVNYLLEGRNPYSSPYVDIYDGFYDYSPGYLYWPASLYLQSISKILFNDIRYILALCWWSVPFFFPKYDLNDEYRKMWWILPIAPYLLVQGWIDPFLAFFAALSLWALHKKRLIILGIALGLAAATKQYGFLIGAFIILRYILDHNWRDLSRILCVCILVFSACLFPFIIIDVKSFIDMTVINHTNTSIRIDSLNIIGFILQNFNGVDLRFFIFIMTIVGLLLAVTYLIFKKYFKCSHNNIAVIADCWIIFFGISVMFGKFAFYNYYSLLIAFIFLSLAFNSNRKAF